MSGDIFGYYPPGDGGAAAICWAEARDAAEHRAGRRACPAPSRESCGPQSGGAKVGTQTQTELLKS